MGRPSLDAPKESSELGSGMQVALKPILHTTLWETTQKLLTWTTIQMSQVMLTHSTFSGTIMILAPKTKGNTCLLYFTMTRNKKNLHYKQKMKCQKKERGLQLKLHLQKNSQMPKIIIKNTCFSTTLGFWNL